MNFQLLVCLVVFAALPALLCPYPLQPWMLWHALFAVYLIFDQVDAIPQNPAYHLFADNRCLCKAIVPNWQNVLSNAPFLGIGLYHALTGYSLLWSFAIMTLSCCSAYYHWKPCNRRLVWDRLPMAVAFMTLYAHWIDEFVPSNEYLPGVIIRKSTLTYALVFLGIVSVLISAWFDDLRLYALVQFYPMFAIPMYLCWFGSAGVDLPAIVWTFTFYLFAKTAEVLDQDIYTLSGKLVSGHTLKHLLAAVAVAGATVTSE